MGSGSYWKDVAIPSGYNLLTDPGSHDDMPYEQVQPKEEMTIWTAIQLIHRQDMVHHHKKI
mgnify:CR=1 FL=1